MVKRMITRKKQYQAKTLLASINNTAKYLLTFCVFFHLSVFHISVSAKQSTGEIEYYEGDNVTNQIPYFDNRFRIDENLKEVTLLFYRRNGAPPVILVQPDGGKIRINDADEEKVKWFDDTTFDMIKIKSPMIGPWQVIGQVAPNSKIMVVSEIKLEVVPLPDIILQGETLKMQGRLFNGDIVIDNPSFNDVLQLDVDFFSTNDKDFDNFGAEPVKLKPFRDDGQDLDEYANDSLFTGEFTLNFAPGKWQPIYTVKTPMATRKLKQTPVIVRKNPVSISVKTTKNKSNKHLATFTINNRFVKADSILIQGKVTFPDKQVEPFSITEDKIEGEGLSRSHNISFKEAGVHRINIEIFGETINGREFRAIVPEFSFSVESENINKSENTINNEETKLTSEQQYAKQIAEAKIAAEKFAKQLAETKAKQAAEFAEKQQRTMIYIIVGNLAVVLIAGILFLIMRRKKTKK